MIDLRSDTLTLPTEGMRDAMRNAIVGDDVYGEDPTTIELEATAAALLGKESALFVTSGTQGNLIAAMIHCRELRSEVICGTQSHFARDELGGVSSLARASTLQIAVDPRTGEMDVAALQSAVVEDVDDHYAIPRLVCLENTQGSFGGKVLSMAYVEKVAAVCQLRTTNRVALHCDGARLWNAAAALRVTPAVAAKPYDTITCCLSKGLGCPVGSVLAGPSAFIKDARWARKMLGGGMRQTGVLAAAGLYALKHHLPRIHEDHEAATGFAQVLQEKTARLPATASVTIEAPQTNIVLFSVSSKAQREEVVRICREQKGVLIGGWGGAAMRVVTSLNHGIKDVREAAAKVADVILQTASKQ